MICGSTQVLHLSFLSYWRNASFKDKITPNIIQNEG